MRIDTDGNDFDGSSSSLSWVTLKEHGKLAFERGDYQAAISKYGSALQNNCPAAERQILLSNMVAARLKVGGLPQAEAAVENAKQCVALNDRWAKGHMRLASAYIALGDHSNDVCNALQRVLQLDPGYPSARATLIRELRRGHATANSSSQSGTNTSSNTTPPEPSAPPEFFDDHDYGSTTPDATRSAETTGTSDRPQEPQPQEARNRVPHNPYQDRQQQQPQPQPPLDDQISLQDRVLFYFHRSRMWYFSLSDNYQTLLKVLIGFLLLYVAFGGRFGLEALGSNSSPKRGNYQSGNAYDQYYEGQRRSTTSETRRGEYQYSRNDNTDRYSSTGSNYQHNGNNDYHSSSRQQQSSRRGGGAGGSSFHLPNLFDGSLQSMLILGGVFYVCHRNGINAMRILFFLNMMNGRGRGRQGGGMFGYGRGMGGGMGGFGRHRRW